MRATATLGRQIPLAHASAEIHIRSPKIRCQPVWRAEELLFYPLPNDETGQAQSVDDHDGVSQDTAEPPEDPDTGLFRDRADCIPPECTWVVSAWHTEMQVDGTHAVSLDITNAFNSIPREEILRGLDQASVPLILRNHIEAFLQLRHAAHLDSVPRG
ncbi:Hypothetical protein GLP15_4996 [Giardia lamblia P15]|uniref:Reverse transcriptase domain-containing protein n=1 Tax=Giardia intestinalis (strain P15) TaxID=658858 RepID=E1F9T9_GIAIA|nr:Hypothetical protein GLP15_4996 [Giardia lamblia P15]